MVRRQWTGAATALLLGCSTVPVQRPDGPVGVSRGSADSFRALVPPSSGVPRCEVPTDAPVDAGGRAVALVFSEPAEQQVTVTLDREGVPTRYMDVRGDLGGAGGRVGDRTTIGLYLEQGYAVLSNGPEAEEPTIVEVPLAEALSSRHLGSPDAMLRQVLAACGEQKPLVP